MGDRVLMQCIIQKTGVYGPVIYGHWCGNDAPKIIAATKAQMIGRGGDVEYFSARLVQQVCARNPKGNIGVGIWNATGILTAADSQGDAGVILIDVDTGEVKTLGGYLNRMSFKVPVESEA